MLIGGPELDETIRQIYMSLIEYKKEKKPENRSQRREKKNRENKENMIKKYKERHSKISTRDLLLNK